VVQLGNRSRKKIEREIFKSEQGAASQEQEISPIAESVAHQYVERSLRGKRTSVQCRLATQPIKAGIAALMLILAQQHSKSGDVSVGSDPDLAVASGRVSFTPNERTWRVDARESAS